jgi:hypothetical protein
MPIAIDILKLNMAYHYTENRNADREINIGYYIVGLSFI